MKFLGGMEPNFERKGLRIAAEAPEGGRVVAPAVPSQPWAAPGFNRPRRSHEGAAEASAGSHKLLASRASVSPSV